MVASLFSGKPCLPPVQLPCSLGAHSPSHSIPFSPLRLQEDYLWHCLEDWIPVQTEDWMPLSRQWRHSPLGCRVTGYKGKAGEKVLESIPTLVRCPPLLSTIHFRVPCKCNFQEICRLDEHLQHKRDLGHILLSPTSQAGGWHWAKHQGAEQTARKSAKTCFVSLLRHLCLKEKHMLTYFFCVPKRGDCGFPHPVWNP